MNDHEAQRIAAALHAARPDWPASSVLTLIRKNLLDRPRRDVFVALAWVASEPNTSTPARVLETGPWWRAAGIDGHTTRREALNPAERCGVCSERQDRCRGLWGDDHDFEPDFRTPTEIDVAATVAALKGELAPAPTIAPSRPLDELLPEQRNPHAQAARATLDTAEEPTA